MGGKGIRLPLLVPEPAARAALKQIEEAAGGREQLFEQLLVAPHVTGKQQHLLSLLADPLQTNKSLALLCEEAGISPSGMLQFLRDAKMSVATVEAMGKIAELLPSVAAETMRKALPHMVPCSSCHGYGDHQVDVEDEHTGEITEETRTCKRCRGTGEVRAEPKHDVQRTALEVGGILVRGPAIQIGMQQNVRVDSGPVRTSSTFRSATDRILYPGRAAPIDVEAEPEPESDAG